MKIDNKDLLIFYTIAFCFLIVYTFMSVQECEAYWMHDASISISKQRFFYDALYLFVLPIFTLLIYRFFKIKTQVKLFLTHFVISLTSVLLLVFAINKPCEHINGGDFMFVSSIKTLGYYLFRLFSYLLFVVIVVRPVLLKIFEVKK